MDLKRYMNEMSIAGYGDWEPSKEMIGTKSALVLRKKWFKIDNIRTYTNKTLEVYKDSKSEYFIAGNFITSSEGDERFEIDFEIEMKEHKGIASDFKIKQRLMNVDGVRVKTTKQGDGISTEMYKSLVKNENIIILGDEIQYFGARKLWSRLSKSIDVVVDIIDVKTNIYLEKDVLLKHGNEDWDFDNRVWSYDYDKKNIRLLLKEIK